METDYIEEALRGAKRVHLTDDELTAHHRNELRGFTRARAEAHLKLCHACGGRVALFREGQNFYDGLAPTESSSADVVPAHGRQTGAAPCRRVAVIPPGRIDIDTGGGVFMFALLNHVIEALSENNQSGAPQLNVLCLSSVLKVDAPLSDPVEVGRRLKADRVLQIVDVRREGHDVSFGTQLFEVGTGVDFGTGPHTDARVFERRLQRFNLKLTRDAQRRLAGLAEGTRSADSLCNQGRFYLSKFPGSALDKAAECFADALVLDENSAEAHAGLADCCVMRGIYNIAPADIFAEALRRARKALEINPALAEAHASQAYAYMCYEWNWARAADEYEKATELSPNNAVAYQGHAHLLGARGKFSEAIEMSDRALMFDPVSSGIYVVRAFILYYAGCYTDEGLPLLRKAREQCINALRLNRRFDPAWYARDLICIQLALACKGAGLDREAEEYFIEAEGAAKKARDYTRGNPQKEAALAFTYFQWGKEGKALKALERLDHALAKGVHISPYHLALVHIARNQREDALERLEFALDVRDPWMILIRYEPAFKVLHGHKRFKELIRKLNFPSA